ncbi:MAG TPA: diacylglycerol kinase family protein [Dehalococcoidales bacterium]|nr:diacylglycerol kinase family protein [Dehalococcoidales bacterium]
MSSTYAKVIVNPTAGAGRTGREWPRIKALFKGSGLRFEHDLTEAPGHAIELATAAARNGYDMVISVGGDGTINEVVNGLYKSGGIGEATLGIISTGTGGDYVRTVGIPRGCEEACRKLLQPRRLTVDLGIVEYASNGRTVERLFVNFAGMGFDAEIVRRTTQQFKALGSLPSYLLGLLATLVSYRNRDVSITIDGEVVDERVCTVIMNNGRYGGGGMLTAPDARVDDGYFDVLIIGDLSKPDLLWSLPRIYRGTHLTHPKVKLRKAREIEVRSAQPLHLQADGELLGQIPARFRVLPAILKVVV